MDKAGPIGVFDSGYGGLTVLKELVRTMPQYDFLYLGDNARAPYGPRSFESIYEFTLQGVKHLFEEGCSLVVLACNTASAEALRTIQQKDLPIIAPNKRVLGVLRPTTEDVESYTKSGEIGIMGTQGTVRSRSYVIEIEKFFPEIIVHQQACPMWVSLVENCGPGATHYVKKYLEELMSKSAHIDAIFLACTHYPLLYQLIRQEVSPSVGIYSQAEIVAPKLITYLQRHLEIDALCLKNGDLAFLTTDNAETFQEKARLFFGRELQAKRIKL
jgi:glutamate racemase